MKGPSFRKVATGLSGLALVWAACAFGLASGAPAPHVIRIGTLYAGSGSFASSSMPQYRGLQFWVHEVNKKGGVWVRAYRRRIPVKLFAYNDQSATGLAGTLYTELVNRDHASILVSDFGSVLTSVAVPIAQEHHLLLIDPTGTSSKFFRGNDGDIVLTGLPNSGTWPNVIAQFLHHRRITRIAIVYGANDFTESQDHSLVKRLHNFGIRPVFDHSVPTSTSNYTVLLHRIKQSGASAVIEFGYNDNDISFLQDVNSSGLRFKMIFSINPGLRVPLFLKAVGAKSLAGTFTYVTPPSLIYNRVNYGLGLTAFKRQFRAWNAQHGQVPLGLSVIAGYNSGLVIQKALHNAKTLNAGSLRAAIQNASGKLFTVDGMFKVSSSGRQIGEKIPLGEFFMNGKKLVLKVVYPHRVATAEAQFGAAS